jgi:Circadian oscillating protein COP23
MMPKLTSTTTPTAMKKLVRPLAQILLSTAILGSIAIPNQIAPAQAQTADAQFYCGKSYQSQLKRKVPTTIVQTDRGKSAILQWVKPMGNYWTPERRCEQFSEQIGKAYQSGTIKYLTNGKKKNNNVICTATEVNGKCQDILMTLRPGDKPGEFLSELKDTLMGRSTGPQQHNSGEARVYVEIDWNAIIKNAPKVE